MEKVAKIVGCIIACITLLGVGYKAGLRGGYITDAVMVKAIAQEVLQPAEAERLEFMLEYKRSQLRALRRTPKEDRSEEELDEIEDLKEQIALIKGRLGQVAGNQEDEP